MIGVSMRMERFRLANGSEELRDCLANDWQLWSRQAMPDEVFVPIPNLGEETVKFLKALPFTGFILSGGDDWGVFPLRDITETNIHNYARANKLPIVGVCRGAQVLNILAGGSTSSGFGSSHTGKRHELRLAGNMRERLGRPTHQVNSFHKLVITEEDLAPGLSAWASAPDGSLEAFEGDMLCGILWHPERERPFSAVDREIFKHYLGRHP